VDEAEVEEDQEDIIELGNARSTIIIVGNYSVSIDIVKHLSARSIDAFWGLGTTWHRFLGIDELAGKTALTAVGQRKRTRQGSLSGLALLPNGKEARVEESRQMAVTRAIKQVLGTEVVRFRSTEQEQAMHAVLDNRTPQVVVLPTGGGKSLLFTVPGSIDNTGVTVVVVPYRALTKDLVARIQGCRINCIEWKHGESNPAVIVVISAVLAGDV
jgi:hypothetical protein